MGEIAFVGIGALILSVACVGIRRRSLRRPLVSVLIGVLCAEAINLGGIMLTAYSAPAPLAQVPTSRLRPSSRGQSGRSA